MSIYVVLATFLVAMGFVACLYVAAKRHGEAEVRLAEEEADAEAARRIADAGNAAPRTPDDLVNRLRQPGAKL